MKKVFIISLICLLCFSMTVTTVFAATSSGGGNSSDREHGGGGSSFDDESSSGGGFVGDWDEEDSFSWDEDQEVTPWNVSVYILRVGFLFGYKLLSEVLMITDSVSFWDFIILCAIVSGLLYVLSQGYGGGTTGSGTSADGALSKRNKKNYDD